MCVCVDYEDHDGEGCGQEEVRAVLDVDTGSAARAEDGNGARTERSR